MGKKNRKSFCFAAVKNKKKTALVSDIRKKVFSGEYNVIIYYKCIKKNHIHSVMKIWIRTHIPTHIDCDKEMLMRYEFDYLPLFAGGLS